MRNWVIATLLSLFGLVGVSRAEFIVIRVILKADAGGGDVNPGFPGPIGPGDDDRGGPIAPPGLGNMGGFPPNPGFGNKGGFPPTPGIGNMGGFPPTPGFGNKGGFPPTPGLGNMGGGIPTPGLPIGPSPRSDDSKSSGSEPELLQGFPPIGPGQGNRGGGPIAPPGVGNFGNRGGGPIAPPGLGNMGGGPIAPPGVGNVGGGPVPPPGMGYIGGNMGGPVLPPGMGYMGGPGAGNTGIPGTANMGGGSTQPKSSLRPDEYVTVVVEVNPDKRYTTQNIRVGGQQVDVRMILPTKYGMTHLYSSKQIQINVVKYPIPRMEAENIRKVRDPRTPEQYLALIEEYLGLGLVGQARNLFDIQAKALENKEAVVKMSPQTKAALEAYLKIKDYITQDVSKSTNAKDWKDKLKLEGYETSKHYALIHPAGTGDKESAKRRLDALEKNLETVYLWFALRGKALNPISEKLVAVQVESIDHYRKLVDEFNITHSTTDGFHARREGLLVFSPERLDRATQNFQQMAKEAFKLFTIEDLLKGKQPNWNDKNAPKYDEYARASTLALVDQLLTEEGEVAAATSEGTKQLLTENGLLPKGLLIPEWLINGLAAIFETPKSNFPTRSGTVKAPFWHGGGAPHWVYMKVWEETFNKMKIAPNKQNLLVIDTITDRFYRMGNAISDSATLDSKEIKDYLQELTSENYHLITRSLSWGLVYYLARERFEQFDIFLGELKQLPRDVDLTDQAILSAFCRSFGVKDFDLDAPSSYREMEVTARRWLDFMKSKKSYASLMKIDDLNLDPPTTGGGTTPGGGIPGGPSFPGGPGFPGGPMVPGFPGGGTTPSFPGGGPAPPMLPGGIPGGFPGGGAPAPPMFPGGGIRRD